MSKLTTCRKCREAVSKSLKTCPHCGSKLKGRKLKFILGGFIALIIVLIAITPSGENSTSEKKSLSQNTSKPKNESIATDNAVTNTQNTKKDADLLSYIGKSKSDIKNDLGNPKKVDGAQSGELYDYGTFYLAIDANKVVSIVVKGEGKTVNGISIGMIPKDVKAKIGNPAKESNSDGFQMDYRLNNNSISVLYQSSDFASPVSQIIITDLTYGKEKPMEVTKEQVNQLMNGTWILEKNIHEKNLSLYKHIFSNGIIDRNLSEHLQKKYEVTGTNAIIMRGETLNGFGSTENFEAEFFIEFFNNGDTMVIYHLDKTGDRDYEEIYIRYN